MARAPGGRQRRGRRALLGAATISLAFLLIGALLLGHRHAVPSVVRLLLYVIAFIGPAVVLPLVLLWRRAATGGPMFPLALAATLAGLLAGWVLVVFGLHVR